MQAAQEEGEACLGMYDRENYTVQTPMSVWKAILTHPLRSAVQESGHRGFELVLPDGNSLSMSGITSDLRSVFWPDYNYQEARRNSANHRASKPSTTGRAKGPDRKQEVWGPPEPYPSNRRRRKGWKARFEGQRIGKLTHLEVETYIKLVGGDGSSMASVQRHKQSVEMANAALSKNGRGGLSVYSRAVIDSMRLAWNWQPVSAEWCVGDLVVNPSTGNIEAGRYATQIDIVAVPAVPDTQTLRTDKLIIAEMKTGYVKGVFELGTGMMQQGLGVMFDNSPLNQAKVQLVMSAAMFVRSYQLKWSQVQLYVVHCPTETYQTLTAYPVTKTEREFIFRTLITTGMLLPTPV